MGQLGPDLQRGRSLPENDGESKGMEPCWAEAAEVTGGKAAREYKSRVWEQTPEARPSLMLHSTPWSEWALQPSLETSPLLFLSVSKVAEIRKQVACLFVLFCFLNLMWPLLTLS